MSRIKTDWTDLDAAEASLKASEMECRAQLSAARSAILDLLPEAARDQLYALLNLTQDVEHALASRQALKAIRHHHIRPAQQDPDQLATLQRKNEALRRQIEQLQGSKRVKASVASIERQRVAERRILALEAEVERLRHPHRFQPAEPTPVARALERKADRPPTQPPAQVQRVARRVEEFVRRCDGQASTKQEVSAALESDLTYLPDAYRHLHASQRVRVTGNRLEIWLS